jgi:hypothetical protein
MEYFAASKEEYGRELPRWFVDTALERPEYWLIPCSHIFNAPATKAEIANFVSLWGQNLPAQLQDFLELTNGAEFFRLRYRLTSEDYWVAQYRVLNCTELVEVNQELLDTFLSYAEHDDKYRGVDRLNYLAFCDVGDGNYLALSGESTEGGKVFYLDHDYGFYPFGTEPTKEAYTIVADTLDEWLEQLGSVDI